MSETDGASIRDSLGKWLPDNHGLRQCDLKISSVRVYRRGAARFLLVRQDGALTAEIELTPEAAAHLASLLIGDAAKVDPIDGRSGLAGTYSVPAAPTGEQRFSIGDSPAATTSGGDAA